MRPLHIVTDSTCNLPADIIEQYEVRIVPVHIQFGEETFRDGIDLTPADFYARVEQEGEIPKTSQPPPSAFASVFEELPAGEPVLSIHVSEQLSGTLQSAQMAARDFPDRDIVTFDSKSFSIGMGFLIWEAVTLADEGQTLEDILTRLRWRRDHTYLHLTTATLRYLRMSGRIGMLENMIGAVLKMKPIITLTDGRLAATERQRTRSRALDLIVARTLELVDTSKPVWLGVIHAQVRDEADALYECLSAQVNVERSFVGEAPPSIVVHGGPGVIGAFVTQANPEQSEAPVHNEE